MAAVSRASKEGSRTRDRASRTRAGSRNLPRAPYSRPRSRREVAVFAASRKRSKSARSPWRAARRRVIGPTMSASSADRSSSHASASRRASARSAGSSPSRATNGTRLTRRSRVSSSSPAFAPNCARALAVHLFDGCVTRAKGRSLRAPGGARARLPRSQSWPSTIGFDGSPANRARARPGHWQRAPGGERVHVVNQPDALGDRELSVGRRELFGGGLPFHAQVIHTGQQDARAPRSSRRSQPVTWMRPSAPSTPATAAMPCCCRPCRACPAWAGQDSRTQTLPSSGSTATATTAPPASTVAAVPVAVWQMVATRCGSSRGRVIGSRPQGHAHKGRGLMGGVSRWSGASGCFLRPAAAWALRRCGVGARAGAGPRGSGDGAVGHGLQAGGELVAGPGQLGDPDRGLLELGFQSGALGVVFGDIGTSPLYALQTVFSIDRRRGPPDRGRRLRRRLAGVLVDHPGRVGQVRARSSCAPTTTARAASWRWPRWPAGRHGNGPADGDRSWPSASSARRCSTATASSRPPSRCCRRSRA